MSENDDNLLKLYNLAEIAYEKNAKKIYFNEENLYPNYWYEMKNYKEKIEIIGEAIKTDNLIINTSRYQNYIKNIKGKKYIK